MAERADGEDVGIAAGLARDLRVETPYLRKTLQLWRDAQQCLPAAADHTEMYRYLEKLKSRRQRRRFR